ncbi:MAG: FIG003003: hypothetical protein, partial [uncultured Thermoleophilia bacterium]
ALRGSPAGRRDQLVVPPPAPAGHVRAVGGGGRAVVPVLGQGAEGHHPRAATGRRRRAARALPGRDGGARWTARAAARAAAAQPGLRRRRRRALPRRSGRAARRSRRVRAASSELVRDRRRGAPRPARGGSRGGRPGAGARRGTARRLARIRLPAPAREPGDVPLVVRRRHDRGRGGRHAGRRRAWGGELVHLRQHGLRRRRRQRAQPHGAPAGGRRAARRL